MATSLNGGALVAEALVGASVEVVFSLPGGHISPILAALRETPIRDVATRHEQAAVLMAAGMALSTGTAGVACVTAGPGLTNALPGMAEAQASGIPVVVIAGRTALSQRGRGAVQDVNQFELVGAVTKWREVCHQTARIPEFVAAAVHHARSGSPGVAYLEIPEDVLRADSAGDEAWPTGFVDPARPVPEPAAIGQAVEMLTAASRPVVLAGSGAFFAGAAEPLAGFAETTGMPVVTTSAARGLLPDGHDHCVGSLVHGGAAMLSSDVPLLLGSRFNANVLYGRSPLFSPGARVIQVDIRPEHTGGQRRPALALVGDVAATLDTLAAAWDAPGNRLEGWRSDAIGAAAASRAQWAEEAARPADPVHPGWLALTTAEFAASVDAPFVVDGGDSVVWGLAFGTAPRPGSHLALGSALGTLGVGMPYATAAALAAGRPSVLFTGDGAFGLSALELDTASRQGTPVLVVVVNNGGWGGDGGPGMRYDLLAEAVGGHGGRVETPDDLEAGLVAAWEAVGNGTPAVVDVVTDRAIHSEFMSAMGSLELM